MADVEIKVRENGPYKVTGPVRIVDAEGREFVVPQGSSIVLCRCGHSATKPFCDTSHKRIGFVAEDAAPRHASSAGGGAPGARPERAGLGFLRASV